MKIQLSVSAKKPQASETYGVETVKCPACKKYGTIPATDGSGNCKCIKCGNRWTITKKN